MCVCVCVCVCIFLNVKATVVFCNHSAFECWREIEKHIHTIILKWRINGPYELVASELSSLPISIEQLKVFFFCNSNARNLFRFIPALGR